jgi:N-glycosylase/DNA lyase
VAERGTVSEPLEVPREEHPIEHEREAHEDRTILARLLLDPVLRSYHRLLGPGANPLQGVTIEAGDGYGVLDVVVGDRPELPVKCPCLGVKWIEDLPVEASGDGEPEREHRVNAGYGPIGLDVDRKVEVGLVHVRGLSLGRRVVDGRGRAPEVVEEAVLAAGEGTFACTEDGRPQSTLEAAWRVCAELFCEATGHEQVTSAECFEHELVFCLLSGFGITYEHALSASEHVVALAPFDRRWSQEVLKSRLYAELNQAQFEPRRRDGSLRRYRFPQCKAELVVAAREWLSGKDDVVGELAATTCERERRRLLCCCPGIGPKTASWLLRNLGLAKELAILDVHVLKALRVAGRISALKLPRDYELAEQAFLDWCRDLDAPAAAFDLFVWEWQRGSLGGQ